MVQGARFQRVEGFDERGGAHDGQHVMQFSRGHVIRNFHDLFEQHLSGIQPDIRMHGCDAGFPFAVDDGPLNGRGPAQGRQKRCMHVDGPEYRYIQQGFRQNLAKCAGDKQVRLHLPDGIHHFRLAIQPFRLQDGNPGGQSIFLDCRQFDFPAAVTRFVFLRHGKNNLIAVPNQRIQTGH